MASAARLVEIMDSTLNLKGSARYTRDRLVNAGVVYGRQGPGRDAPLSEVALILIGVLVGATAIAKPDLVTKYATLRAPDGREFGAVLTAFLTDPHDLLELVVDNHTAAAAVRHRDGTGNVVETTFLPPVIDERPGFARLSAVAANTFTALSAAINEAPKATRKRGRRKRKSHAQI